VPLDRDRLQRLPHDYFAAVDGKDLGRTLDFFAEGASLVVASARIGFHGGAELRRMFETFFRDYGTIRHHVTTIVIDEPAQQISTEQTCPHVRADGVPAPVAASTFFAVGPDGRFTRVSVWMDGPSTLK
jgi:ketosteroid isomerase-like protein